MLLWTILTALFGLAVIVQLANIHYGIKYLGNCSQSDTDRMNELLSHMAFTGGSLSRIGDSLEKIESTLTNIDAKLIPQ